MLEKYKMDKEDIDKNLEYFLYVLLGILGGLASIIVAGLIAYAIGYKRLGRLLAGLIIGRLIILHLSLFEYLQALLFQYKAKL